MSITPQQRQNYARRAARRQAMQALYSWQISRDDPLNILANAREGPEYAKVDPGYFREILMGVTQQSAQLDTLLQTALDGSPSLLDPVEHAVLWIALWELREHPEVPYQVVINEALMIVKAFGAEASHRLVNSVLDRLARKTVP